MSPRTQLVRISSLLYNVPNYYSDNIFFSLLSTFLAYVTNLLVNDDDDVGFSLAFCTISAMFCVFFVVRVWLCDKLAHYAFI